MLCTPKLGVPPQEIDPILATTPLPSMPDGSGDAMGFRALRG